MTLNKGWESWKPRGTANNSESDQDEIIEINSNDDKVEVVSQEWGSDFVRKLLTFIYDRMAQTKNVSHLSVTFSLRYLKTLS